MTNKEIYVADYVNYLSDWNDFDLCLPRGKVILNKSICGCGCTEAYLTNDLPVILVSPRRELINCKMSKTGRSRPLFYFDRSKKSVSIEQSIKLLSDYVSCNQPGFIPKILVTYDSLKLVLDQLTLLGVMTQFSIIVDEFPCIFTDAKMKGNVELSMIRHLSGLNNHIVFISATPIKDEYLDATPEFCNVPIVTLVWPDSKYRQVDFDRQTMRSTREACCRVIQDYYAKGYFDLTIVNGQTVLSTEALFFINSVADIVAIIRKFNLTPDDATVICAEGNEKELAEVGFTLGHASDEKNYKTANKPFTFITKASFEGTDFYSDCASIYVFADPGIKSLSLDISIDLPQIAGRCRTEANPFRNVIHYYYKTTVDQDVINLENDINRRILETEKFLAKYANLQDPSLLQKIGAAQRVQKYKNDYIDVIETLDDTGNIVTTIEGNIYAKLADLRGIEILKFQYKTHLSVFTSIKSNGFNAANPLGGAHGNNLKAFCTTFFADNNFVRRMKVYADFLDNNKALKSDVEAMPQIPMEYKDYYNNLPSSRMKTLGYRERAIKAEIDKNRSFPKVKAALDKILKQGHSYSCADLKPILQQVYDDLKLMKTAKGTDIEEYFPSAEQTTFTDTNGKRKKGYKI